MAETPKHLEEVGRLVGLLLADGLGPDDQRRLEDLLLSDPAALEYYQDYIDVHCLLHWQHGLAVRLDVSRSSSTEAGGRQSAGGSGQWPKSAAEDAEKEVGTANVNSGLPPSSFIPHPSSFSIYHPLHSFVGGALPCYMIAVLILGGAMLTAWVGSRSSSVRTSPLANDGLQWAPQTAAGVPVVGTVTAMTDCRWANPSTATTVGAAVPLRRKYALASGVMQITYNKGANVILQGPATYEVESEDGGFLSFGRLRANVGDGDERQRSNDTGAARPKSPGPSLPSPFPSQPFAVRIPAGTVASLNADFGIETDASRISWAHVFRGTVAFRLRGGINKDGGIISLEQDQSARVEEIALQQVATVLSGPIQSRAVARRMPGPGLTEGVGGLDPQLATGKEDRDFLFRPGRVISATPAGAPDEVRDVSTGENIPIAIVPNDLTYTVRETFELKAPLPVDAELRGAFVARGEVVAVRLNGKTARA